MVRGHAAELPRHKTCGVNVPGLIVRGVHAVVSDLRGGHHDDLLGVVGKANALGIIHLDDGSGRRRQAIGTFLNAVNRHRDIAKGDFQSIAKIDRGFLDLGRLRRAILEGLAGRYRDKSCQHGNAKGVEAIHIKKPRLAGRGVSRWTRLPE
jgi:hypothetical protein